MKGERRCDRGCPSERKEIAPLGAMGGKHTYVPLVDPRLLWTTARIGCRHLNAMLTLNFRGFRTILRVENVSPERVVVQVDWGGGVVDSKQLDPMSQAEMTGQPKVDKLLVRTPFTARRERQCAQSTGS